MPPTGDEHEKLKTYEHPPAPLMAIPPVKTGQQLYTIYHKDLAYLDLGRIDLAYPDLGPMDLAYPIEALWIWPIDV